jgi:hypothetical protein
VSSRQNICASFKPLAADLRGRFVVAETPTDVLVAGHPDIGGAAKDFESLSALVRDTQVSIGGMILVTRPRMAVSRCGRRAATSVAGGGGWGGGVGLAGWPLGAAGAGVGRGRAVVGGVIGKFGDHRVEQDVHGHSDS